MRIALIGLIVLLLLTVVTYFGTGWLVYSELADVRGTCDKHLENTPAQFANVSEWAGDPDYSAWFVPDYLDVSFQSRQPGLDIAGWYLAGEDDAPAIIILDGIGGCRAAQAALIPAGMLRHNGFNVLVIDLRDTGASGSENGYSAMGSEEYLDVLGAWDWLVETKGFSAAEVGILGNSLAAATVLIAFMQEPEVAAVAVNSPYSNLSQIIREQLRKNGMLSILAPSVMIMPRLITNENIMEYSPLDAIRGANDRPIYVVHSSDDDMVSIDHSYQLQAAAEQAGVNATFWFIEGADHVQAPGIYPEEYERRIVGFFNVSLYE